MNLFEKHPRPWSVVDFHPSKYPDVVDANGCIVEDTAGGDFADAIVNFVNSYDATPATTEFRPWAVRLNEACHYEVIRGDGTVFGKDAVRAACVSVVRAVNESHGYDEHGQPINPASTNHDRAPTTTHEGAPLTRDDVCRIVGSMLESALEELAGDILEIAGKAGEGEYGE